MSPAARARVRRAVEAVGLILVRNRGETGAPRPRGSGVIVRADGILVTNGHVITETASKRVFDELFLALSESAAAAGKPEFRLQTLLIDRQYDLALLRIVPVSPASQIEKAASEPPSRKPHHEAAPRKARGEGTDLNTPVFPAIELASPQSVRLLDDLVIIGYPEKGGAGVTLSAGVVEGRDALGDWIKTDARVIHGNSGGAAVSLDGKLIGIPTKVEADNQEIDTDGDGFPDSKRTYGAVGFLRPAKLVADLVARLEDDGVGSNRSSAPAAPGGLSGTSSVTVRGVVKSASTGRPLAGALVGLVQVGTERVSEETLLAWGTANAEGEFSLNNPVHPGKYTVKARALGHVPYSRDVEIKGGGTGLTIELRALPEGPSNQ